MPDLREKSRGYSPETDLRPLDKLVRASNAGELYRLMREKMKVGEIDITDRLHSSVIPGIFEDRKNKTRPVYAREMTLLPQTFEQRQAALEIRSTIGEMMVKARTAAAYDLAVETLQTSDRFPGLSHRIIPTKVRAVVEKDGLKQLEEKIEALEKKYSDRLYPTQLVRAAREELIILESRGVDITEQLISDTFRSYLGQSPFLPASRKPPELKRIKRESNKRGQESHLESQAARSSSSPDSSYHIRSLTPIINRSASIITLASITIPMVACVSNQTEKPVLAVTPSGTDYQPDQTEQFEIPSASPSPKPPVERTISAEITPTALVINFESANWAEDDAGNIDPDILYPIVGSVHNANKRTVDLTDKSSSLKLAVILGEETNMEDANLKQEIADQLNNQEELKKQIEEINNQLSSNDKVNGIVVINGEDLSQAQITQVAVKWGLPVEKRYAFENGQLRQMTKEEEPLLMPPLSAPDHRFIRTDTGEQVMLRGANIPDFTFAPRAINIELIDRSFFEFKKMGGNHIVIPWNARFADDSEYTNKLIGA